MRTENELQVIPLGGLGEFGMNMMALRLRDEIILIDCGKMFPDDTHLGVDSIIPDMSYVEKNGDKILGLFLTHGHEDHIGAVPYLRRLVDVPVYGTPLTLGLTRMRLREHGLAEETQLREVSDGDSVAASSFGVEFIGISHGIPDSCALAISTPAGLVIHTGDFKLDQTPLDGRTGYYQKLARHGEAGVLLLLSDSTNVERPGYTYSEREVYDGFRRIFEDAAGKILVASFASHLHRMQQVIDLAAEFGRRVAFCGRSMEQNSRLARELGYLEIPDGTLASAKEIAKLPSHEVVVIASGSQAEPNSALTRIALNRHPSVKLAPGDVVALSARKIPGNEKSISSLVNHLYRRGAEVVHDGILDIHVSGHACAEELKMMLNLVRPRYFVPIHGEYRMLHLHARLAAATCVEEENILIAESGDVIAVGDDGIALAGEVEAGHVLIDSDGAGEVGETVVRDRRLLGVEGVVVPIVAVTGEGGGGGSGRPRAAAVQFVSKGLRLGEDGAALFGEAELMLAELVRESSAEEAADEELMKAKIGKALRRFLRKRLGRRPMILPVIMEI